MSNTKLKDIGDADAGSKQMQLPEEALNGNSSAQENSHRQESPKHEYKWDQIILDKKVKRNGFSMPLHSYQIISWVIFTLDTYAFYFINIITFSFEPALAIGLGVGYLVLLVGVLYYAIMATKSDPTDPTVYAQKLADLNG